MGLHSFSEEVRDFSAGVISWMETTRAVLDAIGELWFNTGHGLRLLLEAEDIPVFTETLFDEFRTETYRPTENSVVETCLGLLIGLENIVQHLRSREAYVAVYPSMAQHTRGIYERLSEAQ
jgi:hypothetical protein